MYLCMQEQMNLIYIHTNSIKKKEYKNASQQLKIYKYCSMNKQYMERVQKWKKV